MHVFYDSSTGQIAYTIQTDHIELLSNGDLSYIDVEILPGGDIAGYVVQDGELVPAADLTPLKADAKAKIDASAEEFRLQFITPGSGQAMAYQEKYQEAQALLADPDIDDMFIPAILAEVGITADTKIEVAQTVVAMQMAWKQLSGMIERVRLSAKKAVDEATTPAGIEAATGVDWSILLA